MEPTALMLIKILFICGCALILMSFFYRMTK
jgi:hypothetical protein